MVLQRKLFKGTRSNNEGIIFVRLKFPVENIKNIMIGKKVNIEAFHNFFSGVLKLYKNVDIFRKESL